MPSPHDILVLTSRLEIRRPVAADVEMLFALWRDPRVMANVGYPNGLPIVRDEIRAKIASRPDTDSVGWFVVALKACGAPIGECGFDGPDQDGTASTDVKLLPAHWGNRYGVEVKAALLEYLFAQTSCVAVEATPNVENTASIKMQKAVGGVCMGEGTYEFPEAMRAYTRPVHYVTYRVDRDGWLRRRTERIPR